MSEERPRRNSPKEKLGPKLSLEQLSDKQKRIGAAAVRVARHKRSRNEEVKPESRKFHLVVASLAGVTVRTLTQEMKDAGGVEHVMQLLENTNGTDN